MGRTPAADEYMFLYDFKGGDQLEEKPACYIIPLPHLNIEKKWKIS